MKHSHPWAWKTNFGLTALWILRMPKRAREWLGFEQGMDFPAFFPYLSASLSLSPESGAASDLQSLMRSWFERELR